MNERDEQLAKPNELGVCHVCDKEFATQLELSDHLRKEHPDDVLPDSKED